MPGCLGNFPNVSKESFQQPWYLGNFPIPGFLGNSSDFTNSFWNLMMVYLYNLQKFLECLTVWEISRTPGYQGNLPNAWFFLEILSFFLKFLVFLLFLLESDNGVFVRFQKFPKCLGISEISPEFFSIWEISQCMGIWKMSQMPGFLGKFSEFPTSCLNFMLIFNKIFEISQMYGFSGSFPNAPNFFSGNSSDFSNSCWNLIMMYLLILEISQMPGYFGNFQNS